jgi:hypothetical protein
MLFYNTNPRRLDIVKQEEIREIAPNLSDAGGSRWECRY